jgi:predicted TIM-barrel fold metal-dependent hydrolase
VERSDLLGLAQLYQLRGRVGRSSQRAYAYLFHPADRSLSEEAHHRLEAIGEATDLGSGFQLALKDLEIRGAGSILGEVQSGHVAAVGFDRDEVKITAITYEEMRPGCYEPKARLEDMDVNWVEASLSFPTFPRFCGQTFMEAEDKELADLCVKAYNDWMFDEWCAGSGGRLIPLPIIQLWDSQLAGEEIRRNAARGGRAVAFTEIPPFLGLPSIHDPDGYWDPFFRACAETGTVVCMHIGSSSKMPSTSKDAPPAVGSTLTYMNAAMSLTDYLMSGVFEKFPDLVIAYSEGQIGWIPYVLERADAVWDHNRAWGGVADKVKKPPSQYYREHVYGCFFDDPHGLRSLEELGVDTITFETDYPHSDSTWPNSKEIAERQMKDLDDDQIQKIVRGNAIRMLQLDFSE